jgi:hypothetical protein
MSQSLRQTASTGIVFGIFLDFYRPGTGSQLNSGNFLHSPSHSESFFARLLYWRTNAYISK